MAPCHVRFRFRSNPIRYPMADGSGQGCWGLPRGYPCGGVGAAAAARMHPRDRPPWCARSVRAARLRVKQTWPEAGPSSATENDISPPRRGGLAGLALASSSSGARRPKCQNGSLHCRPGPAGSPHGPRPPQAKARPGRSAVQQCSAVPGDSGHSGPRACRGLPPVPPRRGQQSRQWVATSKTLRPQKKKKKKKAATPLHLHDGIESHCTRSRSMASWFYQGTGP